MAAGSIHYLPVVRLRRQLVTPSWAEPTPLRMPRPQPGPTELASTVATMGPSYGNPRRRGTRRIADFVQPIVSGSPTAGAFAAASPAASTRRAQAMASCSIRGQVP